jgi:hypothetical protein
MIHRFKIDSRFMSRLATGLILLVLLALPAVLPGGARAQQVDTPTPTQRTHILLRPQVTLIASPIVITQSTPTVVVTGVGILNLSSVLLSRQTTKTTGDLSFANQFTAKISVQSPSSMLIGESRVITLEVIPELLAQAAMVRAELHALTFDSVDDGYPEKTVIVNTPVSWNWDIAPKEVGEQEFFLSLSYVNDQGSQVHWQNITLKMLVSPAATPTYTPTSVPIPSDTHMPINTQVPTWTPSPTNLPVAPPAFTPTPTFTFMKKVSNNVADNPAPYLGTLVTLLLGLLGVYFQYIRKSNKGSDGKK